MWWWSRYSPDDWQTLHSVYAIILHSELYHSTGVDLGSWLARNIQWLKSIPPPPPSSSQTHTHTHTHTHTYTHTHTHAHTHTIIRLSRSEPHMQLTIFFFTVTSLNSTCTCTPHVTISQWNWAIPFSLWSTCTNRNIATLLNFTVTKPLIHKEADREDRTSCHGSDLLQWSDTS